MKKICILALFNIVFGTIHGQWQQTNGPIGGNVQCYASIGSTILVGVQNGIYKSVNSGLTWIPSDNGISCVNPKCMIVSGNTIFAGTSSGVFISTDLGMNWAASNTGLPIIAQVNCLAIKGQTLFAGTPGGGYVSFNNGLSWIGCGPLTPTLTNGISAFLCVGDTVIAASGCLGMF